MAAAEGKKAPAAAAQWAPVMRWLIPFLSFAQWAQISKWLLLEGGWVWLAAGVLCVLIRAFGRLVTDMPEAQGGDED